MAAKDLQHRPGTRFTNVAFTDKLEAEGVRISMDGRRRRLDNVFVERLWRSLKCEEIHLKAGACPRTGRRPAPWPMVSRRVSASTNGYASTTRADRTKPWVTRHRRQRGRPRSALWICRCTRTTLARRPQLHSANNRPWSTFDEEGERPSPYERAPCGHESQVHRSRAAHDIEPKRSKSSLHCSLKVHDCPSRLLNGSIWRRQ